MFNDMERSVKDLIQGVVSLVYFMKGSIQYDDMMWRTPFERSLIEEFIVERLKRESS